MGITVSQIKGLRGPEIRMSVEDHGPGIPHTDLPHLFEPFYRGSDATAAQIQGNGLGLSIVKRIIEAHGGRVSVATRQNEGTTFTIHLPAVSAVTAPASDAVVGASSATVRS
jgi:signal transduction histidine kinase